MTTTVTMHLGDVRDVTRRLIDQGDTYDLLVTSPPFLQLRSYLPPDHPDKDREIGAEPTPAAFLDTLYGLTADWAQLLPEWASICVELGDTMSGSGDGNGWPLAKSMCLIPHGYTIGLAYGHNPLTGASSPAGQWRIRNVICWARPNPQIGTLGKRDPHRRTGDAKFRPATSYITVACRGASRYFDLDAVREPNKSPNVPRSANYKIAPTRGDYGHPERIMRNHPAGTPPLDWHADDLDGDWLWRLPTQRYHDSHYATFPVALPRRMILAMCPQRVCTTCGWPSERITTCTQTQWATVGWTDCGHDAWRTGRVIDSFGGSGTTAVAAALEHRDAVLIDLDPRNVDLVDRRLRDTLHVLDMHRTGNTVTWTVDAPLPNSGDQVAGQLNLWTTEIVEGL